MEVSWLGLCAVGFLAFSNGANDNIKGVATLVGSRTASYRTALIWSTVTTLAGSFFAFFLAQKLILQFSGKGFVSDEVAALPSFSVAMALGASGTVFLATRLGLPISTTHALTGALLGAGLVGSAARVNLTKLFEAFLLPLLTSPLVAVLATWLIYFFVTRQQKRKHEAGAVVPRQARGRFNQVGGLKLKSLFDVSHFMSSGMVCFARGLNDTPKIAAVLLAGKSFSLFIPIAMVGTMIALGGLLGARRIARTMAFRLTPLNEAQGLTGNLVTSAVVIAASKLGLPVSTTHVSCGSIFGLGAVNGELDWRMARKITLAWLVTLPFAGLLGGLVFLSFRGFLL